MKKFLWFISILCMILGLVTGCSSKDDTGISVTRNVAEKDQQKGSEIKQNKREEDSYEAVSVPVKLEEMQVWGKDLLNKKIEMHERQED